MLNGGTIGGSLGDYYHLLNQKSEVLKPDLVLVGLALNDILVYSESGSILEQRDEQLHGQGLVLIRKLNRFLLRYSQLYIFCYARLKSFLYGSGILDINTVQGLNFVALAPSSAYQKEAWQSSLRMLSKIVEFCRGSNVCGSSVQQLESQSWIYFLRFALTIRETCIFEIR